jgi:hypothetical protein
MHFGRWHGNTCSSNVGKKQPAPNLGSKMKKHVFVWTGTRDKGITVIKYVAQAMVLLKGLLGITQHSIRERIIQESVQRIYF